MLDLLREKKKFEAKFHGERARLDDLVGVVTTFKSL
jgi:hypothetical protein